MNERGNQMDGEVYKSQHDTMDSLLAWISRFTKGGPGVASGGLNKKAS
jgi:hypothetical protein